MTPEIKKRLAQIKRGEVPEGYKRTKAGIIPVDWHDAQIKEIADTTSGSTPDRGNPELWEGGVIPWVTTGELSAGRVTQAKERITEKALNNSHNAILPRGTILVAMYGQGKTRGTAAILEIEATINQACLALLVHDENKNYIFYQLQNSYDRIRRLSNTGGQQNLNAEIIRCFRIPLPRAEEQERIAALVGNQNKLIALKEQLIAEKYRQKQYLMQQLLTGKKRLPGFHREWIVKKAKFIFDSITDKDHDGTLEVLSASQNRGMIPRAEIEIDIKYNPASLKGYKRVKKGDFIISLRSFQGGIEYSSYDGLVSPAYTVLRPTEKIVDEFYKQFFKTSDYIQRLNIATYGIRDGKQISYNDFGNIPIPCISIEEQNAIAEILSTADQEIALLEKDLEQEKQKKKALMQLLLTGIVRV